MVSIFSYLNWWKSNRKMSDVVLCETAQLLPVGALLTFLLRRCRSRRRKKKEDDRRRREEGVDRSSKTYFNKTGSKQR